MHEKDNISWSFGVIILLYKFGYISVKQSVCTTMAKLSSCDKEPMWCLQSLNIYCLTFYRKSLSVSVLMECQLQFELVGNYI